jgi:hypothetical protein
MCVEGIDKFLERIVVERKYGSDIYAWLKLDEEPSYPDPDPPSDDAPNAVHTRHNQKVKTAEIKRDELAADKKAVTMEMLTMCDVNMRRKIDKMTSPKPIEQIIKEGDVKSLKEAIESFGIGHNKDGSVTEAWQQMTGMKLFVKCTMNPKHSLERHGKIYKALIKSVEQSNGPMRPYKYKHLSKEEQEEKRGKLLAMYFLDSLHSRYDKTVDKLHDDYAGKQDKFPTSIDEAIDMLTAIRERERRSYLRSNNRSQANFFEVDDDGESVYGSDYESYDEV